MAKTRRRTISKRFVWLEANDSAKQICLRPYNMIYYFLNIVWNMTQFFGQ